MNRRIFAAVLGAGVLLLAGCAGEGGESDAAYSRSGGAAAPAPAQNEAAPEIGTGGDSKAVPGGEPGSPGGSGSQGSAVAVQPRPDRDVIYTADLRVSSDDVAQAGTRAKKFVADAGGHVSHENALSEPGIPAGATITFKIPAERYKATLDQLAGRLGTRLSLRQTAEDVTEQVADVDSRVTSAKAALASYRKLLSRADTIEEILSVEREITQRESDLESLVARQKALSEQTSYATVNLRLESTSAARTKPQGGFVSGLKSGWNAFLTFVNGAATAFGWLLPFLVTATVAGGAGRLTWRAVRRRRRAAAPAAPPGREPAPGAAPSGDAPSGAAQPGDAPAGAAPASGDASAPERAPEDPDQKSPA